MRDYELTLILKPDPGDEVAPSATERVGGWITAAGGQVASVATPGRKRLAYPVGQSRDGSFVVMQVRTRPEALPELERSLKLSEDILRYMFIRR